MWWIVSEGDVVSLWIGLPAALGAALFSLALEPRELARPTLLGSARFAGFFLVRSVLGGMDVALRALRPSMPIAPRSVVYPLRLVDALPRVVFVNTLSLLPGTLSTHLDCESLVVHVLDCSGDFVEGISRVEDRVADLFGISLDTAPREVA